jgi:SAM-dependent methyltransferase
MKKIIDESIIQSLRCPVTHSNLEYYNGFFSTIGNNRKIKYPVINNTPILINESNSLFTIEQYESNKNTTRDSSKIIKDSKSRIRKVVSSLIPSLTTDLASSNNFNLLEREIKENNESPVILIIGGATLGSGMSNFMKSNKATIIESDVAFGPNTNFIFDAHDIPFKNKTFDAVIIQAVLEHVLDPVRCVSEIYRVLKDEGLVYSDTPFMQQVHMGKYDFTRFTYLGHIYLFKDFDKIKSGMSSGPGSALSWSIYYFLISFTERKILRRLIYVIVSVLGIPLKSLDYLLKERRCAYDAAGGFYFIGRKSLKKRSDAKILDDFIGCNTR